MVGKVSYVGSRKASMDAVKSAGEWGKERQFTVMFSLIFILNVTLLSELLLPFSFMESE